MAIILDGANKQITVDTSTSFAWLDIYNAAASWAALSANLKYLLPMTSTGKAAMGGGVFTDLVFTLVNGWKIKPSGYAANSQVTITGTIVTSDGSAIAVAPTAGSPVQWYFQAATAGTISVTGGSALTSEEHNKLMAVPTTPLLAADYVAPNNSAIALLLAANWTWTKSGNISTYVSPDGLTRISYTPNASGGVDAAIV